MLKIENLTATVGEGEDAKTILNGLSLSVPAGEVHAIMGPNGAGKSTLSYVLTGREGYTVTGGTATLDGDDLLALDPEDRAARGVFLSFQYPVEIPGVPVMTFVRAAMNAQRKARGEAEISAPEFIKKSREIAKVLSLDPEMLKRPVNVGFSGGEKKRNEILQLLMLNPKLALLDETDSGLDVDAVQIVSEGVAKFHNEDNSCLIITHNTRILEKLKVDKVHVLINGEIVEEGGPELIDDINRRGFTHILDAKAEK